MMFARTVSHRIMERAGGRCECVGECGINQHTHAPHRCTERHNEPARRYPHSRVELTTTFLNYLPHDTRPENIRAMCPRCNALYTEDVRETAKRAKHERDPNQGLLFEI